MDNFLPITLKALWLACQTTSPREQEGKAGCKCGMEYIAGPWHPVMSVRNVGVGIMPGPEQEFDAHDVEWDVNQNNSQANWKTDPKT